MSFAFIIFVLLYHFACNVLYLVIPIKTNNTASLAKEMGVDRSCAAHATTSNTTSCPQVDPWWPQKKGRPKETWRRTVEKEMKENSWTWGHLERQARDRSQWRTLMRPYVFRNTKRIKILKILFYRFGACTRDCQGFTFIFSFIENVVHEVHDFVRSHA